MADSDVLGRAAESVGLDAKATVAAGVNVAAHETLTAAVQSDFDDEDVFGVPTLILPNGARYWGHDRIEWAIDSGHLEKSLAKSA